MTFFLGCNEPSWMQKTDVPLFVSRRRLCRLKTYRRALGPWALDSGGFTELQKFGRWETSARQYVDEARRYRDEIGNMQWAAIQDWMCEPAVIHGGEFKGGSFKGTGLSVLEHQKRTIWSYFELMRLAPEIPWVPVVQGYHPDDYLRHVEMYQQGLVYPMSKLPLVGVGSVCRRESTPELLGILRPLSELGLKMHGFGVKVAGLLNGGAALLASSDSMAWSRAGRMGKPLAGCPHRACTHCIKFAMQWRDKVLRSVEFGSRDYQHVLFA